MLRRKARRLTKLALGGSDLTATNVAITVAIHVRLVELRMEPIAWDVRDKAREALTIDRPRARV